MSESSNASKKVIDPEPIIPEALLQEIGRLIGEFLAARERQDDSATPVAPVPNR